MRGTTLIASLVAGLLCVLLTAPAAHATVLEIQRFDRPLTRCFPVTSQGAPIGVVQRQRWRQVWRRTYTMQSGMHGSEVRAQQSFGLTGLRWPWWLKMHFSDAQGHIGSIEGTLWTLLTASWVLRDRAGEEVAQLHLDDHAQTLLVSSPGAEGRLLGQAVRVQQASSGRDSWALVVDDSGRESVAAVWPLILAFIADTYEELVRTRVPM